jgi:hypothetical protein
VAADEWIRNSDAFDGGIDFDALVRDTANPKQMLPAYEKGDNLHPNDAGYKTMAESIDLKLFTPAVITGGVAVRSAGYLSLLQQIEILSRRSSRKARYSSTRPVSSRPKTPPR